MRERVPLTIANPFVQRGKREAILLLAAQSLHIVVKVVAIKQPCKRPTTMPAYPPTSLAAVEAHCQTSTDQGSPRTKKTWLSRIKILCWKPKRWSYNEHTDGDEPWHLGQREQFDDDDDTSSILADGDLYHLSANQSQKRHSHFVPAFKYHHKESESILLQTRHTIKLRTAPSNTQQQNSWFHRSSHGNSKSKMPSINNQKCYHMNPVPTEKGEQSVLLALGSFTGSVESLDSLAESYWDPADEHSELKVNNSPALERARSGEFFHEHLRFLKVQTQPRQVEVVWSIEESPPLAIDGISHRA